MICIILKGKRHFCIIQIEKWSYWGAKGYKRKLSETDRQAKTTTCVSWRVRASFKKVQQFLWLSIFVIKMNKINTVNIRTKATYAVVFFSKQTLIHAWLVAFLSSIVQLWQTLNELLKWHFRFSSHILFQKIQMSYDTLIRVVRDF